MIVTEHFVKEKDLLALKGWSRNFHHLLQCYKLLQSELKTESHYTERTVRLAKSDLTLLFTH